MKSLFLTVVAVMSLSAFAQTNTLHSKDGEQFINCAEKLCKSQVKSYHDWKDYGIRGDGFSVIIENGEFEIKDLDALIGKLQDETSDRDTKLKESREKMIKLGYRKKKLERIMRIFEEVMTDKETLLEGLISLKSGSTSQESSLIVPMRELREFILFKSPSYKRLDIDVKQFENPSLVNRI